MNLSVFPQKDACDKQALRACVFKPCAPRWIWKVSHGYAPLRNAAFGCLADYELWINFQFSINTSLFLIRGFAGEPNFTGFIFLPRIGAKRGCG